MIRSLGAYTIVKTSLEKSGRKKNRTRFFLSFSWRISEATEHLKRKSCISFRTEYFERKFVYQLLKPIFDASVRLPQVF